jgi:hypothetical protein
MSITEDFNRIKIALIERKGAEKWLEKQLGKSSTILLKGGSNMIKPSIITLLDIDWNELFNKNELLFFCLTSLYYEKHK